MTCTADAIQGLRSRGRTVDAPHDLVHLAAQVLVLWHVEAAWHRDLNQHNHLPVLGVLVEKLLEREKLLRDALDDVEAVHAEHNLQVGIPVATRCTTQSLARAALLAPDHTHKNGYERQGVCHPNDGHLGSSCALPACSSDST